MSKVTLANTKYFFVNGNETLLDAAKASSLVLDHGCRTGRCGVCKAKVISGKTRALKAEEGLSASEQDDGMILTCCRTAIGDVVLDIDDIDQLEKFEKKTLPCRIDSIEKLTSNVTKVVLRLPPNSGFNYFPGQYIDMIGRSGLRRSYSIASSPKEGGKLELHIQKVEQGIMSKYWFSEAMVNDLLRLEGPFGTFVLRESRAKHIVFLATGTGIAPVKSMLKQLAEQSKNIIHEKIHVYWGCRTRKDVYWKPELCDLEVNFHPVLSRPDKNWDGKNGYIQDVLLDDNIPLDDAIVYACGSNNMIYSAKEILVANGLELRNFHSDAFVSSN